MIDTVIHNHNKIDIFCLGTPSVPGDAIGPLVGSMLCTHEFDKDIVVIGTTADPVTYSSYRHRVNELREDSLVIVVDATLGRRVGTFDITFEPTCPGAALSTGIEPVGDVSIKAYTGSNLKEMLLANSWEVTQLAYRITTELKDLLSSNKKGIYIEI
jgi:putative sporulation protein YyaC